MRRKQQTYYYPMKAPRGERLNKTQNQIDINPLTKHSVSIFPDSLERFQQDLESSLMLQREINVQNAEKRRKKRRTHTQMIDSDEQGFHNGFPVKQVNKLQTEISELKSEVMTYKRGSQLQDKLDRLLDEMVKNRQIDRQIMKQQRQTNPVPPNNIFYPPQIPQMPYYPPRENTRREPYQQSEPNSRANSKTVRPKNRLRRKLRKYFFVVLFTTFLKRQAKQLAQNRRSYLRTFFLQKFNPQMVNLKNWLVQCHSYAFPVILEKQKFEFEFWTESKQAIQKQKQNLLLKLVEIGLQKMRKDCTSQKISFFSELLQNLCGKGSFAMSRFWSAYQMKHICVSQLLGCFRTDQTLQKFLIGTVVFVKVLVFNMLLQPHKFDAVNFPKNKQPLYRNMYIIASIYYKLAKDILIEYLQEQRAEYYELGNWLSMPEGFIVECCQPLMFKVDYPDENQWISGLLGEELQDLERRRQWIGLINKMREIIQTLHREVMKRRKEVVRNQKYKLYH